MTAVTRLSGVRDGLGVKAPCRVATTANITLSGEQTIDGVSCVAGDRVLVKDQTDTTGNGIWVVSTSAWTRATDFDSALDVTQGTKVPVAQGTVYAGAEYYVSTASPSPGSALAFAETLAKQYMDNASTSATAAATSASASATSATASAVSATAAATSATASAARATAADSSATAAASSATSAATSADAAAVAGTIYADEATGRAAVADGAYFLVEGGDDNTFVDLHKRIDASTVTTSLRAIYAKEYIDPLRETAESTSVWSVQDANGTSSAAMTSDGTFTFGNIIANTLNGLLKREFSRRIKRNPTLRFSRVGLISYGQSLGLGNGSATRTRTGEVPNAKMFDANGVSTAGPRAQEGGGTQAQNHGSLIDYNEAPQSGSTPTGNMETPLGAGIITFCQLVREEDGIDLDAGDAEYEFIGSAPAQSNTAIAWLQSGQTPYTNLSNDVTYGKSLSATDGKVYGVDAVLFSQGERDISLGTAKATYTTDLATTLYNSLNTDIKAATGQTNDIKLIMYQCSTYDQYTGGYAGANIALAQTDAAEANSNIIIACPVYAVTHLASNNVHLDGRGYSQLGAYYMYCYKRVIVDGDDWPLFKPSRILRNGNILDVEFPLAWSGLAFGTELFPAQTRHGFVALDSGAADNAITEDPVVVAPNRIRIKLTSADSGTLRYGINSATGMWGGNLYCESDFTPDIGLGKPLHHGCLIFEETFA